MKINHGFTTKKNMFIITVVKPYLCYTSHRLCYSLTMVFVVKLWLYKKKNKNMVTLLL